MATSTRWRPVVGRLAFFVARDAPSPARRRELPLKIFGSVAAISALLYALGYLISISHFSMLGVNLPAGMGVEITNDHIVYRGANFPILSLTCVFLSFFSRNLRGWALVGVLFMILISPEVRAACRKWWPHAFGFQRWCRSGLGQTVGLAAVTALLLGTSVVALSSTGTILAQSQLLLDTSPAAGEGASTHSRLLGAELDLRKLHQQTGGAERRTLYGLFLIAGVFCANLWLRVWRGIRQNTHLWLRWFGTPIMIVFGLPVALQLYQIPLLFGYLVPEPTFPQIEVRGDLLPADDRESEATRIHVFLLGTRGSTALLYHLESRRLWWVKTEDVLPAKSIGEANPLHSGASRSY